MVNAISIAHNHDLTSMIEENVCDQDFANIFAKLTSDITHEPFSLKEGS